LSNGFEEFEWPAGQGQQQLGQTEPLVEDGVFDGVRSAALHPTPAIFSQTHTPDGVGDQADKQQVKDFCHRVVHEFGPQQQQPGVGSSPDSPQ
jgi:hypothetical protein